MMRLRQVMWRVLPVVFAATLLLAPGASAGQRHHAVKQKVAKHHPRRSTPHRASRHVAKRKATHSARTHHRRAHHYAHRRYRRRYHRRRVRLPLGPSSNRIEQIQQALERSGFYQGDPTGRWDSSTVEAMKSFQQAHGITPTGKIDATSLQKLGLGSDVAGVAPPRPVLPVDPPGSGKRSKRVGEGR